MHRISAVPERAWYSTWSASSMMGAAIWAGRPSPPAWNGETWGEAFGDSCARAGCVRRLPARPPITAPGRGLAGTSWAVEPVARVLPLPHHPHPPPEGVHDYC